MKVIKINEAADINFIKDNKFNTTVVCLLIRRPLKREEATLNTLLLNVLKNGSRKYNSIKEMHNVLDAMYGGVFSTAIVKKGEEQILQFYIDVLGETVEENLLAKALDFLTNILFDPNVTDNSFDEEVVVLEKENLKQNIKNRINNKAEYIKLKALEYICEGEAFGIYADGYYEDVDSINAKELYEHYKMILDQSKIEIVLLSQNENDVERVKEHFSPIGGVIENEGTCLPSESKKEILVINEAMEITQAKLCIGVKAGVNGQGEDFAALLVLNEILGGAGSSKLFNIVREENGLCYNINSLVYRFKGFLMIQCGVDKENIEKTVQLIKKIIEDLKNGKINQSELENAKLNISNSLNSIRDYPSAIIDFYVTQKLCKDYRSLEEFIDLIKSVNLQQVKNLCEKLKIDTVYSIS